jgi:hypothetical protein
MTQSLTLQFTVVLINVMMHSAHDRRRQQKTDGSGMNFLPMESMTVVVLETSSRKHAWVKVTPTVQQVSGYLRYTDFDAQGGSPAALVCSPASQP